MPSQMVHLAIAQLFAGDKPWLINCPEYYLGSIVPDAMHMRKGADVLQQKDYIHFKINGEWRLDQLQYFYRSNIGENDKVNPLIEGYTVHILSDFYWWTDFVSEVFKPLLDLNPTVQERKTIYYGKCGCIERLLYKKYHWSYKLLELIKKAESNCINDILRYDEVEAWKKLTIDFYKQDYQREYDLKYLTEDSINDFINCTVSKLKSEFMY